MLGSYLGADGFKSASSMSLVHCIVADVNSRQVFIRFHWVTRLGAKSR